LRIRRVCAQIHATSRGEHLAVGIALLYTFGSRRARLGLLMVFNLFSMRRGEVLVLEEITKRYAMNTKRPTCPKKHMWVFD